MSLRKLAPQTITIPIGEDSLTLRGVSLPDLSAIFQNQGAFVGEEIKSLTELALLDGGLPPVRALAVVETLLRQCPPLAASIIAAGAGEADDPAAVEVAQRLPLGAQVAALEAVWTLTFAGTSPQRVINTVIHAVNGASAITSAEFAAIAAGRN